MKNDVMFNMIKGSCTATAPEILSKLSFDAAAEYKDTVPVSSVKKSYIKAAVVYAAACLVIAVAIPFIIMNVREKEPPVPSASVTEKSINAEDINEIYNKVDSKSLPQKVTVEEVEKIIEASRLAYDDYDVIVLSDGTKITTTPKKPDITEDDLEGMFYGDERLLEYKKYFDNMMHVIYDAISARFSENSTRIFEPMDYASPPYASFWVLDLEATAFTDSEIIEYLMFENGNENIRYFCDIIAYGFGSGEKHYFAHYTETVGTETMLFPTKEEYEILCAELPPADNIKASDINRFYNDVDPDSLSENVTREEVENIIQAVRLAYDDYSTIVLSDGTKITTTSKKPEIEVPELEVWSLEDQAFIEYKEYFDNMYRIIYDAINSRFSEKSTLILDVLSNHLEHPYPSFWIMDLETSGYENADEFEKVVIDPERNGLFYSYPCDMISFMLEENYYFAYCESGTTSGRGEIMLFPTEEEYALLTSDVTETYDNYRLAIEDEILAAESVRTKKELYGKGYFEVYNVDAVSKQIGREGGVDSIYVNYSDGYKHQNHIYIKGHNFFDGFSEDDKRRVTIEIWTGFVLIDIDVMVELNNPIILPEAVEKELRYILNIEKAYSSEQTIPADDIRYLDSDVGYKFAIIERDGKCGLINTDGEIILPVEYSSIDLNFLAPSDMRLRLQAVISSENEYTTYWIEADGTLTENLYGGWGAEGGIGIYWMNGKPIMIDFFEGEIEYSVDRYTSDMGYKWSYAVASGKQSDIIPIREIKGYTEDQGWYYVDDENLVSNKYALYNFRTKELITDFIFDDCSNEKFVEGILPVKKDGKWGYVNESGEMITDFIYDASETKEYYGNIIETMYYTQSGYTIVRQGDLFGLMDKNGEFVLDIKYDDISQVNPDGYVWVKNGSNWTVIKIS